MTLRRIFISHSAHKDPDARPALDALEVKLNTLSDRFGVLLDHSTLAPGEVWRSALNVWCGICDAAILLVTKDSIERDFCVYEWSILGYRRMLSNDFKVLPIFLGTTPEDISGKPQQIAELQGPTYTTIDAVWPKIEEWLDSVVAHEGPALKQVELIASLFRKNLADPSGVLLRDALKQVGERLGTWEPLQDVQQQFALKLIELGLQRAAPALLDLRWAFSDDDLAWQDVVGLVKSSWVDDISARTVSERSLSAQPGQVIALNASDVRTGVLYVVKASGRPPSHSWSTAEVTDGVFGLEALKTQIWASLAQALRIDPTSDPETINNRLKGRQLTRQPVIVCLPTRSLDTVRLADLRASFPHVTFFLLAGSEKPGLPDVQWLEPALKPGFEAAFWKWIKEVEYEFAPR
jgi:hypothetical protein